MRYQHPLLSCTSDSCIWLVSMTSELCWSRSSSRRLDLMSSSGRPRSEGSTFRMFRAFGVKRRIRRFTPKARNILNVLPSDLGRPLEDIKSNLRLDDLDQQS